MQYFTPKILFPCYRDLAEDSLQIGNLGVVIFKKHGTKVLHRDIGFTNDIQFMKEPDCVFAQNESGLIVELIIGAQSAYEARNIAELYNACLTLLGGEMAYRINQIIELVIQNENSLQHHYVFDGSDTNYYACKMMQMVINDDLLRGAVVKYSVVQEVFRYDSRMLEPTCDDYNFQYLLSDQIKMGYYIVILYSALEDLKLEVNASKEKPSVINGKYNPLVVEPIRKKLLENGIKPDMRLKCLSRAERKIPRKKTTQTNILCEWSDGKTVRDFKISIVDAIFELSMIRSKYATHGNISRVADLCLYDVENANDLIRTVLLEIMKYKGCDMSP